MDYSLVNGELTDYTYGTSGYDKLLLTNIQKDNYSIHYEHDYLGRVTKETRNIDGSPLTVNYFYDAQTGKIARKHYQESGRTENYMYDTYGYLERVTTDNVISWELAGNTGTETKTTLANGVFTRKTILNAVGLLSSQQMLKGNSSIHSMNYNFNAATGNLAFRMGMMGSETFSYDSADRLTAVQYSSTGALLTSYQLNGNIDSKTGVGHYYYNGGKPHAVIAVDNTENVISHETQEITYNGFNKTETITERVGSDDYEQEIIYGPDQQRWKTILKKNNAIVKTIIFAPDYERVTENGSTKEFYYTYGNDGLAAVQIKEAGQADKFYYAYTDHLGSIMKLVDNSGNIHFSAVYDAWGKQNVSTNTIGFNRGYTGHEHLLLFGLINMNGRMYDPVLGRMLAPDPYVADNTYSQDFNRYTYARNNPLKYTDPDGEWIHIVIGAVIGGAINLGTKAYQGKINSWGDGFAAFGIGAVSGAIGAATGGAAFAAAGGAAGGVGGFLAGAAGGAFGSAFASPFLAIGNSLYFKDPMMTGSQYLLGIVGGALLGGAVNGTVAAFNGRSFWNGSSPTQATTVTPTATTATQPTNETKPYNANYQDQTEIQLPEKVYKYTYEHPSTWENPNTIFPGKDGSAYYTTDGSLNSLNAKINLSLPKQPSFRIEISTTDPNFNFNNIQIIRTVNGNVFNSGGGGWEILYNAPYSPSHSYQWNVIEILNLP